MASNIKPLGLTLGPLLNMIGKAMRVLLKEKGISYSLEQLYILTVVRDSEEVVVQQDLAETLGKDKSFILRIVDSLENDGLIRRIVDSNDRRRNILEVTYLGNQLVNRFYEIEWKVTEVFFKGISEEEIDAYYSVIAKIRANFDNCELIK
ncbi:MAG: MarR family transcriptional regulator [Breznakibacter sp.]|nr:MarR family transcriptional regulator [Breznakibacter sp.]